MIYIVMEIDLFGAIRIFLESIGYIWNRKSEMCFIALRLSNFCLISLSVTSELGKYTTWKKKDKVRVIGLQQK